jgi:hypothetical protein
MTFSLYRGVTYSGVGVSQTPAMPNTQGSFTDLRFTFAELDTKYAQGTPPASPFFNENVWGIFPGSSQPWVNVPVGTSFGLKLTSNVSMVGGGWSLTVKVSTDGTLNNARTYSFDGAANGSSVLFISSTNTGGYGWYSVESVQCTTSITTPGVAYLTNMYVGITTGGVLDVPTSSTVNGFYPLAGIGAAELSVSPQIYESCRINAASCLFQNTTSSLNKDGTVKAYVVQTVNNAPWDTITNQLVAANDAAVILRYNDYLEKGMYTFFQPQMSRTDFVDSTGRTSIGYSPAFSLGTDNYYYFALMSPTSAAQQVTLTYVVHHEARNTSMLYPIGTSRAQYEDIRQASISCMDIVPFVENPLHLGALAIAAKNLAASAWRRARPHINPLAHKAVDYFIPRYRSTAVSGRQKLLN